MDTRTHATKSRGKGGLERAGLAFLIALVLGGLSWGLAGGRQERRGMEILHDRAEGIAVRFDRGALRGMVEPEGPALARIRAGLELQVRFEAASGLFLARNTPAGMLLMARAGRIPRFAGSDSLAVRFPTQEGQRRVLSRFQDRDRSYLTLLEPIRDERSGALLATLGVVLDVTRLDGRMPGFG